MATDQIIRISACESYELIAEGYLYLPWYWKLVTLATVFGVSVAAWYGAIWLAYPVSQ